MSASMRPTRCPARANATARLADTVDLPTPPLPDEIARTLPRCGSSTGVGGGGTPPGPARGAVWRGGGPSAALLASVTLTRTAVTPGTACTALRTSRASEPGSSRPSRNVKLTVPRSSTARSLTMPAASTSPPRRGFFSCDKARSTRAWRGSDAGTGGRERDMRRGGKERVPGTGSAGFCTGQTGHSMSDDRQPVRRVSVAQWTTYLLLACLVLEAGSVASRLSERALLVPAVAGARSEEHTSELQSRFGISYAVFC